MVVIAFAGYVVTEKWRQYSHAETLHNSYQYSIKLSNVVYAMQKERGLTAGFVSSAGRSFSEELREQRQQTDEQVALLQQGGFQVLLRSSGPTIKKRVGELMLRLGSRLSWRMEAEQLDKYPLFTKYTNFNRDAIHLLQAMGDTADDAELIRLNRIYGNLLWIQEFAGQERGVVNGILAAGVVGSKAIVEVNGYIAKQTLLIDELKELLWHPVDVQAVLGDRSVVEVDRMRAMLLLRVEKVDLLNELQSIIGYGGFIHQFKNYVIRGDNLSRDSVIVRYQQVQHSLDRYRQLSPLSEGEVAAIEKIQAALDIYHENLLVVEEMHRAGASLSAIDQRVAVDDSSVIKAIFYLANGIPDISADRWFVSATKRIDLFKELSDDLKQVSLRYIKEKRGQARFVLTLTLLITIVTLLVAFFLGVLITHRLVTGSANIINALNHVEKSGDFSGHIAVDGRDEIAEIGRSFNQLIEGRQSAEEQLWLASRVFSSTIDGIMVTNMDEQIVLVNPAFTTITGYSEEEIMGQTPRKFSSSRHDETFFKAMWEEIHQKGFWQGEIWNCRKNGEVYPQWQHISVVLDAQHQKINYIAVFSDISVIKHSQEKLEHLAHHDALTGLPNRIMLDIHITQGIERAKRQNKALAVLFLDLDRFKNVNDSLGHPAGDELLKQVSLRLKQLVRAEDLVARLGGDEFALVLEAPTDGRSIARIAQKCIDAFLLPFEVEEHTVYTSTSLGISVYPEDGERAGELLKHADTAMYHAKEQGRNSYSFYNRQMTQIAVDRLALEAQLRQAIEQNELILQYQPQISLLTGEISGVEALIRWRQADGSLISPSQFIPIAEESALIDKVDRWVLGEACRQAKEWLDIGLPPINMAVNISGFSIEHGMLLDMVEEALEKSQLNPEILELEITEHYLMQHREQATLIIEQLREQGLTFSIDDFGTGYSSLGYLKTLPINRLKIDQSFIRDIPDDESDKAITRAVIALGHSMQMKVVAEGVESKEQAAFLAELGCEFAQGYLFSEAVSAERIVEMLSQ